MFDETVRAIQRFYPQVYLACHAGHVRSSSTEWKLSSHDSSLLAHLYVHTGMRPRDLSKHLGVAASSLSASLKRLEGLGYITNEPVNGDRRRREVRLTEHGAEAMAATSVLDTVKLQELLSHLTPEERRRAVGGLELLAKAAHRAATGGSTE